MQWIYEWIIINGLITNFIKKYIIFAQHDSNLLGEKVCFVADKTLSILDGQLSKNAKNQVL